MKGLIGRQAGYGTTKENNRKGSRQDMARKALEPGMVIELQRQGQGRI